MEETVAALDLIVRQGKALYVGISSPEQSAAAIHLLKEMGTSLLIHQPSYNMFNRSVEDGLQEVLSENSVGSIAFCPLAQGLLTNKYLSGIPSESRAAKTTGFLKEREVTEEKVLKVKRLHEIAIERGQSLAQMALVWVLREGHITSALIGASQISQIEENVAALNNLDFTKEELSKIDAILV